MSYRKPKIEKNQKPLKIKKQKKNIEYVEEEEEEDDLNGDELNVVVKAFEYFDKNHNGKISISELRHALASYADIMSEDEINDILRKAGIENQPDNDQEINYMDFINFWIGKN